MGIGNSKQKKRAKQTIITNTNVSEFQNGLKDNVISSDTDDYEENAPVLKWHKANQKEDMIKIQQEAEIRDIEAIYENSCLREADLFNLMPDHYWTGKENKLPRYFRYQGDYPDRVVRSSNLERLKSSSLNDLVDSNIIFETNDNQNIDPILSRRTEISMSCPHIQMTLLVSLSKPDKTEPKKGILKNRNIYRPNSALLLDHNSPNFKIENVENNEFFPDTHSPNSYNYFKKRNNTPAHSDNQVKCVSDIPNNHLVFVPKNNVDNNDNPAFSGYFDLSPSRIPDGSSQVLKVNVDKKSLIKSNLDKRLNMRPTSMDLANRNILRDTNEKELCDNIRDTCNADQNELSGTYDFEKTRCVLNKKLSFRPTVTELKKRKIIKFNDFVEVQETDNYDRTVNKAWMRLTEHDKEHIRLELNQFKEKEMKIHSKSKRFTKFHDMNDD